MFQRPLRVADLACDVPCAEVRRFFDELEGIGALHRSPSERLVPDGG